jgi:hypothetical protein
VVNKSFLLPQTLTNCSKTVYQRFNQLKSERKRRKMGEIAADGLPDWCMAIKNQIDADCMRNQGNELFRQRKFYDALVSKMILVAFTQEARQKCIQLSQ